MLPVVEIRLNLHGRRKRRPDAEHYAIHRMGWPPCRVVLKAACEFSSAAKPLEGRAVPVVM
jgi:hypothetical protein